ncbi:hypothetical protein CEY16_00910 [Halalkalibacillus sediminis]|uniref:Competence protein CoiA n=1 Tax=Halalkalibacillus sediminis TaxID=2018042 RepID=A0A2I0QW66_9BACI|nr:competence protein CoiA family protein [Halalkalibacillus sediminis]PKR78350.1 hypothetical protein CEY16_00910 [Halalkalibacillus sediminis]
MLKAIDSNGKDVVAFEYSGDELEALRHHPLMCPSCREPVLLKAGPIKLPHFSHHPQSSCAFRKGETPEHIIGKTHFYEWFNSQQLPSYIEYFVPSINQRVDVLTKVKEIYYAIEYQCSPITQQEFRDRTEGMISAGIRPIWIFGSNYLKPSGINQFKLNPILRIATYYSSVKNSSYVLFYDSSNQQLITLSDIHSFQTHYLASMKRRNLSSLQFKELFDTDQLAIKKVQSTILKSKNHFRTKSRKRLSQVECNFLKKLYEIHLHPQNLPSCINLPIKNGHLFKHPPYEWQTELIIKLIHPLPVGAKFTFKQAKQTVADSLQAPFISVYPQSTQHPISSYLNLLVIKKYLKYSNGSYYKLKSIYFPKTLDEALKEDRVFLNH